MEVPTGAWQRDWISRHGGAPDGSVTVRYVQTPSVFGDVRVREDLPDMSSATSFAELSDDQLAALATQNGFAGFTTIDGANATWHHEIDFQPSTDEADVGRIEPVGDAHMLEHALDQSYLESWTAIDRKPGAFAVRIVRQERVDQILAVAGGHFVYARARPRPLPEGPSIRELIAKHHASRDQIIGYLDCEISYGTTRGWWVEYSTVPWRQGKRLAFADRITIGADGQPAATAIAPGEKWSFPVNTLAATDLQALFAPAP